MSREKEEKADEYLKRQIQGPRAGAKQKQPGL